MLKKIAIAAPMAILALTSSMAFAIGEARHAINLLATIPSDVFYVLPVDPDLIVKDQRLIYDPFSSQLSTLRAQFDTKNSNGSIAAMLENAAYLSNGVPAENIQLAVTFNGRALNHTAPVEVLNDADSTPGKRVELTVAPTKPTNGYVAGDYTGVVALRFDAVLPVTP